jgi:predicted TIM-barrel fold metal-dependent hydrolase
VLVSESLDWLVSVDDHVLEPPDVWLSRLPARYRDRAPTLTVHDGRQAWMYEGKPNPVMGLAAVAGTDASQWTQESKSYAQMRPAFYDPVARLADMDQAGILASLCFPTFPRFCGQAFYEADDKDLAMLCVRAYNDWMIEEWCAAAPGRYIPLIIIPLWDPAAAAREVRRNAARGSHAVCFSENPEPLGLPTIFDPGRYWDPLWDACQETQTVICMHIGSSSRIPVISADFPSYFNLNWAIRAVCSGALMTWLLGPALREFPGLKIALSEGGIGWMPSILERTDELIRDRQDYYLRGERVDPATRMVFQDQGNVIDVRGLDVYQMFRDHVYGCFISDKHGIASIREIGTDNVMIETDYPHSDGTWPHSIRRAHDQLAVNPTLTHHEKYNILRGNAQRLFHFTPAEPEAATSA